MPELLRRIKVQYPGTCQVCGRALPEGSAAFWSPSVRGRIWCLSCGKPKKDEEEGPAPSGSKERNDTRQRQTSNSQEDWERLCRYLRDCVQAEAADTFAFLNRRDEKWFLHRGGSESLIAGKADSFPLPQVGLSKATEAQQSVVYGWPTLVVPNSRNHLNVAPLFVVNAVNIDEGRLFANSEPEFNAGVTAGQLFDRSFHEEVKKVVGDGVPFGDAPSLVLLASRISDVLGLEIRSALDPESLDSRLGNQPGMYNAAVVIAAESRFVYVKSLVNELDSLVKRTDWRNTAAAWLLGMRPRGSLSGSPPTEPLAAPLQTNHSQEAALQQLRTSPLTVVKGPPGTGKTQLVANAASNAWLDRDKILVTSTNNGAVDVASDRAEQAIYPGLLLRTGNRDTREHLSKWIAKFVAEPKATILREEEARSRLARAHSERAAFWEDLETQSTLHEALLRTVEQLETSAAVIWGQSKAPELPFSCREVASRIDRLQGAWFFRRRRARRFLQAIGCDDLTVDLDLVKGWAEAEQHRQAGIQQLREIRRLVGHPDRTAMAADEKWAAASQEAVRAVAVSRLSRSKVATSLLGIGNRAGAFRRGIQEAMEYARGWACTAMSMGQNFSLKAGLFDLVIIDEASQCTVAQALPLAYRAKRIAVVGDPNQLTPIAGLLPKVHARIAKHVGLEEEDLKTTAVHHTEGSAYLAFEYQAQRRDRQQPLLLSEHYRSQPEIARWFNQEFYNDELTVLTELPDESKVRVPALIRSRPVIWTDVEGRAERGPKGSWVNHEEATWVVRQLAVFLSYAPLSIGVVAPFRGQVDLLEELAEQQGLKSAIDEGHLQFGTAHRYQGDECDLVVFTPVVAPGIGNYAADWIEDERNLLNVAASRARRGLVMCGHPEASRFGGPTLASLRRYAIEKAARNLALEGRYRTDSRSEQMLLDAMRTAGLNPIAKLNVGGYELDFALHLSDSTRLNVEVDGDQHIDERGRQCRQDITRDRVLNRAGWDVLRMPAWRCIWDTASVVRDIKRRMGYTT